MYAPMYEVLVLAAGFAAFFTATVTGVGGTLLLLPFLLQRFDTYQSVAIMAAVLGAHNLVKLWVFRRVVPWRAVGLGAVGAIPTTIASATLVGVVPESVIRWLVAALCFWYASTGGKVGARRLVLGPRGVVAMTAMSGVFSGLGSVGGPGSAIAFVSSGLSGAPYVAAMAGLAFAMQMVKLPIYVINGVFEPALYRVAIGLSVASILAIFAARPLVDRLSPEMFRRILRAVLGGIGIYLLF